MKTEEECGQTEIKNIKPTEIPNENAVINVNHKILLTMLDGKCINAVEGNKCTKVRFGSRFILI